MKNLTSFFLFLIVFSTSILNAQITIEDNDLEAGVNYTWTSNNEYLLDGLVIVKPGSTLNIEPGTVIKSSVNPTNGIDASTALIIARGATINALGEATCPIIFTSEVDDIDNPDDLGSTDQGLWGGIAICGNGEVAAMDGISSLVDFDNPLLEYGGSDNTENSGIFRYVSIRHAGAQLNDLIEMSNLTLAGVGSGTTVEYVESYAGFDDGFEFLGGAVNAKYLIAAFNSDEAFDIDLGYQGKGQFWFGINAGGGYSLELDGATPDDEGNPSNPILSNLTLIGNGENTSGAIEIKDNAKGSVYNSIITLNNEKALSIEFEAAPLPSSFNHLSNGDINFAHNLWFDFLNSNDPQSFLEVPNGTTTELDFLVNHFNTNNNETADPLLSSICYNELNCLDPLPQSGSPALLGSQSLTDPYFENVDYRGAFGEINWMSFWSVLYPSPFSGECVSLTEGKITLQVDANGNCDPDLGEIGLANWIIEIKTPTSNYFVKTNGAGEYVGLIPSNAIQAVVQPINDLWSVCTPTLPIIDLNTPDAVNAAFTVVSVQDCPLMNVDLSTPFLRRCFDNTYTVNYCNEGTALAENVRVEIELDEYVDFISSPLSFTINSDGKYVFELDDLAFGQCASFKILVNVSCESTLGQTHCSQAEVFPPDLCNPLSKPQIEVIGECVGSEVIFMIKNISNIDMPESESYIVTEDHVMVSGGSDNTYQLAAGATKEVTLPANGSTYHLHTVKIPGSPELGFTIGGIEGCGTNGMGTFSLGFLNGFNLDAGGTNIDLDCQENIGAFDPNDITAYPSGIQEERYLRANTDIEYRIRFQNTGTDTAFNVVLVDSISPSLNLNSIRIGSSSHDYTWELEGRTLKFNFDNIMLPDSNVNEVASHGFVNFSIQQVADLADETHISNAADIYFDFNDPIRTNTEFYTIGDPIGDVVSNVNFAPASRLIKVFPNPFTQMTVFDLEKTSVQNGYLEVYDNLGRRVRKQQFSGNTLEFTKGNLVKGIYFFQIMGDGARIGVGKLSIQ